MFQKLEFDLRQQSPAYRNFLIANFPKDKLSYYFVVCLGDRDLLIVLFSCFSRYFFFSLAQRVKGFV
jgi:hypothetical protein